MQKRFTTTIDLTARARRTEKEHEARTHFPPPDPPLPNATKDTLSPAVRSACDAAGWPALMPVQSTAIPYVLDGRDLIVQSRTGSGKTGAFILPFFDLLDASQSVTQALVLTPTRELARQIFEEFVRMNAQGTLTGALVYGGVGYEEQIKQLRAGAHLVVGTPGRILDHLQRRTFTLSRLSVLVLDEADEMLSLGFMPDMQVLQRYLPPARQSYMFSATMPPKVRVLGRMFLNAPAFLGLSEDQISVETIRHWYCRVDQIGKSRALIRLLEVEDPSSAIVFANTRTEVSFVASFLRNYGFAAAAMSGKLTQQMRERAMQRLKTGRLRILVATDVAARGIDISQLSHVIQYDVPQNMEMYIHRTGRTARAGRTGTAITLATFDDVQHLGAIARYYALDMEKRPLPTEREATERIVERTTEALEGVLANKTRLDRERLTRFIPLAQSLAQEKPALLAMLLDELHQRHSRGARNAGQKGRHGRRKAQS